MGAVGLIPGLGILKNADEVVTLLKNALPQLMPYADEMATVLRQAFRGGSPALGALAGSTRYVDNLADAGQAARRADDLAEGAEEIIDSGRPVRYNYEADTLISRGQKHKQVFLPKDEYAHVMSEVATNITQDQQNTTIFEKAIGLYIYTFENLGFGNYRVIGKRRIRNNGR